MKQLLSTLSHSTQRYLAALTLLFLFSACTQTPTPNNSTPTAIQASDEEGNNITTQAVPVNGLKGDYYNNMDFTGTLVTRYDANVNRNWGTAAPITGIANTTYSVRWTGQIMPQFSQEYTFFVTSSGGARLMVNGQALVNNWTDHTSKVDSGKVTLQANVKYDIRLEFYRNTVNPAVIKLEWQSASRARQVVPQARLFTTGTYSEALWRELKQTYFQSTDADIGFGNVYFEGDKFLITIPETNSYSMITAVKSNGKWLEVRKSSFENDQLIVTNVLRNLTADFGALSSYMTMTKTQKWEIEKTLHPELSNRIYSTNGSGKLQSQRVPGDACPSCQALGDLYWSDTRDLIIYTWEVEVAIAGAIYSCKTGGWNCQIGAGITRANWKWIAATSSLGAFGVYTGWVQAWLDLFTKVAKLFEEWENCKLTASCDPKISNPTPNPLKLEGKVGEIVFGLVTARNIGYFGLIPTVSTANKYDAIITGGLFGNLLPENATLTILIEATCETAGTTYFAVILKTTSTAPDPTYQEQKTIDVELKCIGEPKILADSKSWSLEINQSLLQPDNIVIKNDGTDVLKISNFDYQVGSLGTASITPTLPPASPATPLEIPAGSSRNISVTAACGSTVGTLVNKIIISSNAIPNPLVVNLSLKCKANTGGMQLAANYSFAMFSGGTSGCYPDEYGNNSPNAYSADPKVLLILPKLPNVTLMPDTEDVLRKGSAIGEPGGCHSNPAGPAPWNNRLIWFASQMGAATAAWESKYPEGKYALRNVTLSANGLEMFGNIYQLY